MIDSLVQAERTVPGGHRFDNHSHVDEAEQLGGVLREAFHVGFRRVVGEDKGYERARMYKLEDTVKDLRCFAMSEKLRVHC